VPQAHHLGGKKTTLPVLKKPLSPQGKKKRVEKGNKISPHQTWKGKGLRGQLPPKKKESGKKEEKKGA